MVDDNQPRHDALAMNTQVPLQHAGPKPAWVAKRVLVQVPATCANLGPGFDCLALALTLYNAFDVTLDLRPDAYSRAPEIQFIGRSEDVALLASESDNLFFQAFQMACASQHVKAPPLQLTMHVNLPPGRGLGSSATAVLGGVLAANALLGEPLAQSEVLELALRCEPGRHADNVSAALTGGVVVTGVRDTSGHLITERIALARPLRVVLFIPAMPMSTARGRSLLPPAYTREDVTFNLGRVALLVAALQSGRLEVLGAAMEDRIHQPYRQQLFPALPDLIAAARGAGALGAALSGGGSSVIALVAEGQDGVAEALSATAVRLGIDGTCVVTDIARDGASAQIIEQLNVAGAEEEPAGE